MGNMLRLSENGHELMKDTIQGAVEKLPFGEDNTLYYLMGIRTAITLLLNESCGLYGMVDRGICDLTEESRK